MMNLSRTRTAALGRPWFPGRMSAGAVETGGSCDGMAQLPQEA